MYVSTHSHPLLKLWQTLSTTVCSLITHKHTVTYSTHVRTQVPLHLPLWLWLKLIQHW